MSLKFAGKKKRRKLGGFDLLRFCQSEGCHPKQANEFKKWFLSIVRRKLKIVNLWHQGHAVLRLNLGFL